METYIYWIVGLIVFETVAKIIVLGVGAIPQRTPGTITIDIFIGVGLIVWGLSTVI